MKSLKSEYGMLISWNFLGRRVVLLNNIAAIRAAFVYTRAQGTPLAGRVKNFIKCLFGNRPGTKLMKVSINVILLILTIKNYYRV